MQNDPQTFLDAIEFVTLGYGDLLKKRYFRSLNFRTDLLTTRQVQAVIRLVTTHNAFNGERVAAAIEPFARRVRGWEFGREGSPVLYAFLAYTENQLEDQVSAAVGPRIGREQYESLVAELQATFRQLDADEVTLDEPRRHEFRAWWG
jgi:hypothetical protein